MMVSPTVCMKDSMLSYTYINADDYNKGYMN